MIKLFVSDIDGCLAEPYRPFDRRRFQELAAYADTAGPVGSDGVLPSVSVCSGRSLPYVEAMTQALGLQVPVLFEAGGGLFDPLTGRVRWHPNVTDEVEEAVEQVRRWMLRECLPGSSLMYDYGKRTQAGLAGSNHEEIAAYVPIVERYVARLKPAFCVFHTPISVDVLPVSITKKQGMRWLSEHVGCSMEHIAFIGDSNGDLGALDAVGYSFAPANAADAVKERVQVVTDAPVIDGVLEAYRWCLARNEAGGRPAPKPSPDDAAALDL